MPGLSEWLIILILLAIPVICGVAAMSIAAGKGRDARGEKVGWFLFGFFFDLFQLGQVWLVGQQHVGILDLLIELVEIFLALFQLEIFTDVLR